MVTAYILATTATGKERDVLYSLKNLSEVKEVYNVYGDYDLFAKIETETAKLAAKAKLDFEIRRVERLGNRVQQVENKLQQMQNRFQVNADKLKDQIRNRISNPKPVPKPKPGLAGVSVGSEPAGQGGGNQ